ncbi:hypothetical protein XENOCAPTIV_002458, partial [Xenoophorus captivus]
KPGLVDHYISTLLTLDQSPTTVPMLGVCLDFCSVQKDKTTIEKHKANNAQLMEEAVKAMQNLAQQCSDATAVQDIVTHLFKILGGSEGKLTIVAQKTSVLSVHEGTLVHAVSVLSQWSSRLTVEVPATLLDWFKKAYNLKTSTSAVRHAYLQTMLQAFRGDTLAQSSDLIPLLLQTVEKAAAQNSQHALLAEGVAASVLLSRHALLETQAGSFLPHMCLCSAGCIITLQLQC